MIVLTIIGFYSYYVILICFITAPAGVLTTPCLLWFRFCYRLHLHFSPSLEHANPTSILDPHPLKRIELLQEKLVVYFSSSNHGKVETGYGTSKMMLPLHSLLGPLFTELLLWVEWYFAFSDILVSSCRARVFNMITREMQDGYTVERYKYIDPSKYDYAFGYPFWTIQPPSITNLLWLYIPLVDEEIHLPNHPTCQVRRALAKPRPSNLLKPVACADVYGRVPWKERLRPRQGAQVWWKFQVMDVLSEPRGFLWDFLEKVWLEGYFWRSFVGIENSRLVNFESIGIENEWRD